MIKFIVLLDNSFKTVFLYVGRKLKNMAYRGTIFLHRMSHFMIFVLSTFPRKEAVLTHVKIEAFEASISEPTNGRLFADTAFGGHVPSRFRGNKAV